MIETYGTIGIVDKLINRTKIRKGWVPVGFDMLLTDKLRRL